MLNPLFITLTILSDSAILIFVLYYFLKVRAHEKELEKKESKIDTEYHQVVDNALSRERKILDDATAEADQIIANAQYATGESQKSVDEALAKMTADIHNVTLNTAQKLETTYQESLKQMSGQSLADFNTVVSGLKKDLEAQIMQFNNSLLPGLEKELEEYKSARQNEIDKTVNLIIQKVAQEVFKKSIPLSDHTTLIINSIERAKKEGMFG